MLNINDATIRKYETFQFVTYNFKDLNIKVSKSELIEFLKSLYKTLSSKEVIDKKEEMKQIKGDEIQYILFHGDFIKREGFEYIYSSKDASLESKASFYMFEQTIAENFHLYFSLGDKKEALKPKRQDHEIEEIVIYMAQFFNETEKQYEELYNKGLNLLDEFVRNHS